jgi:hypothetical protein
VEELPLARPNSFAQSAGCAYASERARNSPRAIEARGSAELQALLQTDNIAPVDRMTFGMRLAELIIRVRNMAKPRQRK